MRFFKQRKVKIPYLEQVPQEIFSLIANYLIYEPHTLLSLRLVNKKFLLKCQNTLLDIPWTPYYHKSYSILQYIDFCVKQSNPVEEIISAFHVWNFCGLNMGETNYYTIARGKKEENGTISWTPMWSYGYSSRESSFFDLSCISQNEITKSGYFISEKGLLKEIDNWLHTEITQRPGTRNHPHITKVWKCTFSIHNDYPIENTMRIKMHILNILKPVFKLPTLSPKPKIKDITHSLIWGIWIVGVYIFDMHLFFKWAAKRKWTFQSLMQNIKMFIDKKRVVK